MTQEDIIRMAREAGLLAEDEAWVSPHQEAMECFAALVAAHEREACAKVCDKYADRLEGMRDEDYQAELAGRQIGATRCAAAIRVRGNNK